MKHVDDEERHEKRLGRLAHQNDQSAVEQLSINLGKRRLDIEDAYLALAALYGVPSGMRLEFGLANSPGT
jgi:hypothetical protein